MTYDAGLATDSRPRPAGGPPRRFRPDGLLDFVVANGQIRREHRPEVYPYENPPILWRNRGDGRFNNVTTTGRRLLSDRSIKVAAWPSATSTATATSTS